MKKLYYFYIFLFITSLVFVAYLSGVLVMILEGLNIFDNSKFIKINTWYLYKVHYADNVRIQNKANISMIISIVVVYFLPFLFYYMLFIKKESLHGDARFANKKEINEAGLIGSDDGILVGKLGKDLLTFSGKQFVLLSAPTRSGKGVGVVIPNLLIYKYSVVVLDIKQENFNITSGYRSKFSEVYLFNPFAEDYRSHRYNPLEYVRGGDYRIGDLQAIAKVFYPGEGKDAFFDDQALNLFIAVGLYVLETPYLPKTIGEMLRQSSGDGSPMKEFWEKIITNRNYEVKDDGERGEARTVADKDIGRQGEDYLLPLSTYCVDALNRFISNSDNTLSSILASFNAPLGIFVNPIVDASTSTNDFDLRDLRKKKMTIYIGITPDHLPECKTLINLLFSQIVNLNTKELPENNPELKYPCMLLMDEFTAIGKVTIIAKACSYIAGYNLRLLTIIQSMSQLNSVYGQDDAQTLRTNHALQIVYAPREQKDANEVSEMLGYKTTDSESVSGKKSDFSKNHSSSKQKRALLLPQEVKDIGLWKELLFIENVKPIVCEKIKYFTDKFFMKRKLKEVDIAELPMKAYYKNIDATRKPPPALKNDDAVVDYENYKGEEVERFGEVIKSDEVEITPQIIVDEKKEIIENNELEKTENDFKTEDKLNI